MKMNKLTLGVLALAALSTAAFAQDGPSAKSVSVRYDNTGFGVTYLNDGYDGFVGVTGKLTQVAPRLSWNALLVKPVREADQEQTWVGTALQYNLVADSRFSLDVLAGLKGFDLSKSFAGQTLTKESFVWGVSVGVKF